MYYDDEARRFNFASGLLLGAVIGAGLALVALPKRPLRKPKRIRGSGQSLKRAAKQTFDRVPDTVGNLGEAVRRAGR